jgi:hypothetical protein
MWTVFDRLNVVTSALVALSGFLAVLFFSVPVYVGIMAVVVMSLMAWYATRKFYFESVDPAQVRHEIRTDVEVRKQVLSTTRAAFGLVCPILVFVLLVGAGLWKHAPEMMLERAVEVVSHDVTTNGRFIAIRYRTAPALSITRVPSDEMVGAPVVALAPSAEELTTERIVTALPLTHVIRRSMEDTGTLFGNGATIIAILAFFFAIGIALLDILFMKAHVKPPSAVPGVAVQAPAHP